MFFTCLCFTSGDRQATLLGCPPRYKVILPLYLHSKWSQKLLAEWTLSGPCAVLCSVLKECWHYRPTIVSSFLCEQDLNPGLPYFIACVVAVLYYFSLKKITSESHAKQFVSYTDGAAMRAGVQTGDRIIKVKQSVSWESCGLQRLPRL